MHEASNNWLKCTINIYDRTHLMRQLQTNRILRQAITKPVHRLRGVSLDDDDANAICGRKKKQTNAANAILWDDLEIPCEIWNHLCCVCVSLCVAYIISSHFRVLVNDYFVTATAKRKLISIAVLTMFGRFSLSINQSISWLSVFCHGLFFFMKRKKKWNELPHTKLKPLQRFSPSGKHIISWNN